MKSVYIIGKYYLVQMKQETCTRVWPLSWFCLTKNVPYVIHAVPENKIKACWLMDELVKCIQCFHLKGINVEACVCDNHPTNVSACQKLLALYGKDEDGLRIYIEDKPIYLLYDAVHLIKNIRNNPLHQKRLLFLPFSSHHLGDKPVEVKGGRGYGVQSKPAWSTEAASKFRSSWKL